MIQTLNGWSAAWSSFMIRGLIDAALLLAIVAAVWLLLRRRLPAQVGYCLFLLVLLKLPVPLSLPVPSSLAYLSPRYSLEKLAAWATTRTGTQPDLSAAEFSLSESHSAL